MKLALLTVSFLAFSVWAQNDNQGCPAGTTAIEDPPGSGNIKCKTTTIVCPGQNRDYVPVGGKQADALCCKAAQQLVIYDDKTREGVCCDPNLVYVGTKPNGACCKSDQIVKDGKCTDKPVPPDNLNTGCCGDCPKQPNGMCQLTAACGDAMQNGLKYGSCYSLTFPEDGHQLGRGTVGAVDQYIKDGYIQNIVYKVCKQPAAGACGQGTVGSTDPFYIQDMTGSATDATGAVPAWMNNAGGGTHMSLTTDPKNAGKFTGKTSCSNCKCVVKLNQLGYACPAVQPGITFWPNPNVGLDLQFTEVPCDGDFTNFTPAAPPELMLGTQ